MVHAFSKSALERPWYRHNDTTARNEAARRGYEAVLIVTVRHPDSREYEQFAQRVRRRAIREYGHDVYGDEVYYYYLLIYYIFTYLFNSTIHITTRRHSIPISNPRRRLVSGCAT